MCSFYHFPSLSQEKKQSMGEIREMDGWKTLIGTLTVLSARMSNTFACQQNMAINCL